jgi:hypothetical protein
MDGSFVARDAGMYPTNSTIANGTIATPPTAAAGTTSSTTPPSRVSYDYNLRAFQCPWS